MSKPVCLSQFYFILFYLLIILFPRHLTTKTGFSPFSCNKSLTFCACGAEVSRMCACATQSCSFAPTFHSIWGTGFLIFLGFANINQQNIQKLIRNDFTHQLLPYHGKKSAIAFLSWVKSRPEVSRGVARSSVFGGDRYGGCLILHQHQEINNRTASATQFTLSVVEYDLDSSGGIMEVSWANFVLCFRVCARSLRVRVV